MEMESSSFEKRKVKNIIKILTIFGIIFGILIIGGSIYFSYIAINSSEFDRYHEEYVLLDNGRIGTHVGIDSNHPNDIEMFIFKLFNKKANYLKWNK